MHVDAAAAPGVIEHKDLSKVRHIDTDVLWLQEQQVRPVLPLKKVFRTDNIADLMTKIQTTKNLAQSMNLDFGIGRSDIDQKYHPAVLAGAQNQPQGASAQTLPAFQENRQSGSIVAHDWYSVMAMPLQQNHQLDTL